MAKTDDANEPLIEFFKTANINAVYRVLERAQRNADRAADQQAAAAHSAGSTGTGTLTKALNKAMAAYGRAAKGRASIRQKAPDTGGRPYHFGYSNVTRGERASTRKAGGATSPKAPPTKGSKGRPAANTREAAHQIYTERDSAVERDALDLSTGLPLTASPDLAQMNKHGMDGRGGRENSDGR